ncbi:hypothetical protein LSH36_13g25073 [Paralvinella palmiformis]|uniref:Sulfatase N-terminal domain-containing protein n=1 Tax=Paralvinella palmiformis TaxID=53620 RepID=A0AAD9KCV7_9ANNE|nr:hypothetical protein LSH36_13g25073 [Paralvinella palmiformis]
MFGVRHISDGFGHYHSAEQIRCETEANMRSLKGIVPIVCSLLLIVCLVKFREDGAEDFSSYTIQERRNRAEIPRTKSPQYHLGKRRMNVFLMMTDDMRTQLGCYSGEDFSFPTRQQKMSTPNFDRLAAKSLLVKRAYAQYSLCGPSRTSMLTSRRPDTTRVYGNERYWRVVGGNFTTLPQYFKQHGYHVIGLGKVFHQFASSNNQDPISWTEPYFHPPYTDLEYYPSDAAGYKAVTPEQRRDIDLPLTDEASMEHVRGRLEQIAPEARTGKRPFFIALGFCKPHLNFVCPSEFFKHYPLETKPHYLPVKEWQTPVVSEYCNMANVSFTDDGRKRLTDSGLRHLRQAYSACISYVDSLVGQVLDLIDKHGLAESTIVAFVGDHGHHNGENAFWGKQTNYELATHIPMMIHIPGKTDHGIVTRSLVEGVDVYPTIVEAAGLGIIPWCPPGSSSVPICTEGQSMLPLIADPEINLREAAFHQVRQSGFMAYAIRTDRHRYVAYAKVQRETKDNGTDTHTNIWEHDEYWTELYDLYGDPEERYNKTDSPEYQEVKAVLDRRLKSFFTGGFNIPTKEKKA